MREIDKKYLPKETASGLKQKPGSEILAQRERESGRVDYSYGYGDEAVTRCRGGSNTIAMTDTLDLRINETGCLFFFFLVVGIE